MPANALTIKIETDQGKDLTANYLIRALTTDQMKKLCDKIHLTVNDFINSSEEEGNG